MQNATTRRVRSGPKMSRNVQFRGRMYYFLTKYLRPYPKIHPNTSFWGPFNAMPIIHGALRKSHVNGATKLKLYSYIGIDKYLGEWGEFFPLRGVRGAQGPLMQLWDPHIISETTRARKLKLKTQLDVVKFSLRVQYFSARWRPRGAAPSNVSK